MTITVFAAGGTGINIAKQIRDLDVAIKYIDTSDSNLQGINSNDIYLAESMDGAGKDRSLAYERFKDEAADVLIRLKPSEHLNIVIGSISGGGLVA